MTWVIKVTSELFFIHELTLLKIWVINLTSELIFIHELTLLITYVIKVTSEWFSVHEFPCERLFSGNGITYMHLTENRKEKELYDCK